MKNNLLKLLLLFLLPWQALKAQKENVENKNGIYISDTDFERHRLTFGFNKKDDHHYKIIQSWAPKIKIKTEDTTYTFYYDQIWGYRRDEIDHRIFDHRIFNVEYIGKCCIYSQQPFPEDPTSYFFSVSITGPVIYLSKQNLISAFDHDKEFVKKIKAIPFWKSVYKWDKKKHRFKFIDWIK